MDLGSSLNGASLSVNDIIMAAEQQQPFHQDYTVIGNVYSSKKATHDIYLVYRDVPLLVRDHVLSQQPQPQELRILDFGCGSAGSTSVLKNIFQGLGIRAGTDRVRW